MMQNTGENCGDLLLRGQQQAIKIAFRTPNGSGKPQKVQATTCFIDM